MNQSAIRFTVLAIVSVAVAAGVIAGAVALPALLFSPAPPTDDAFEATGKLSELALAVYDEVADIDVDESGPTLRVTFVNSAFNDMSERERAAKARQIARLLVRNYGGWRRIRVVAVAFVAGGLGGHEAKTYTFFRPSLR
jgi:hypothetical protein